MTTLEELQELGRRMDRVVELLRKECWAATSANLGERRTSVLWAVVDGPRPMPADGSPWDPYQSYIEVGIRGVYTDDAGNAVRYTASMHHTFDEITLIVDESVLLEMYRPVLKAIPR